MQATVQHIYRPPREQEGVLYAWFASMHTRVDLMLCSRQAEEELMSVVDRIREALRHLEQLANCYDPASELAGVNSRACFSPIVVSEELYQMIDLCLQFHGKTLGCFDITVHSDNYTQDTIHSVVLSSEERSIFFRQEGVKLNLSGFLKGYALETIREILKDCRIENALLNMGNSSVLGLGNNPHTSGWSVSFEKYRNTPTETGVQGVLLRNQCLTTSGNDSESRKHIISPRSGKLVEGARQVAVVTADGITGEILSTALFAADKKQQEVLLAEFSPSYYYSSSNESSFSTFHL